MNPLPSTPPSVGFQQSTKRSLWEGAVILLTLAALGLGIVWAASHLADWALPWVPESVDEKIGEVAWKAMVASSGECTNRSLQTYVEDLLNPLAEAEGVSPSKFHVAVVDEDLPNASALPGGYLLVHSGLVQMADDGAEISAVLAHELAHVKKRHGMRRVLRSAGASLIFGLLVGGTDIAVLAGYAEDLSHLSYDRDQEREADEIGRATLKKSEHLSFRFGAFF